MLIMMKKFKIYRNPIHFFSIIVGVLILSSSPISFSLKLSEEIRKKHEIFAPVIKKMLKRGMDTSFVYELVDHHNTNFNKKYVTINVVPSGKKANYSYATSDVAVSKSKTFLEKYSKELEAAEKRFGVPKEVITSILWVETRQGDYLGDNHIPSVYLTTALATEPEYLRMNEQTLKERFSSSKSKYRKYKSKLHNRSKSKAKWALDQLVALEKLQKVSPVSVHELYGSWAGAFGISQFLPSSYMSWSYDGDGDGTVDLFKPHDAIFSVANYLKTNGWGNSRTSQRKAVYHYNHSKAYVNAVLKLASLIESDDDTGKIDFNTPIDHQMR